jgi:hypothetical protein
MNLFETFMATYTSDVGLKAKKIKGKRVMELDNVSTMSLPPELSMNCIEKLRPSQGVVLAQENIVIA